MTTHFSNRHIVKFVSAPCSTGKTRAACQFIADNQYDRNHLYVAPSIDLLNQTLQQLASLGVDAKTITSVTHPKRVKAEIIGLLNAAPSLGTTLLITWSAYSDLPFFHHRDNWTIIIDEVPQIDRFFPLMLPHNHDLLVEHLQAFPTNDPSISLVKAKTPTRLKNLLDGVDDDVHQLFQPLFRDVLSRNRDVYVDNQSWDRIALRNNISKENEYNTIYFVSMLKPELFADVILLGANLEDSLLFHWFQKQGVRFGHKRKSSETSGRHRQLWAIV